METKQKTYWLWGMRHWFRKSPRFHASRPIIRPCPNSAVSMALTSNSVEGLADGLGNDFASGPHTPGPSQLIIENSRLRFLQS